MKFFKPFAALISAVIFSASLVSCSSKTQNSGDQHSHEGLVHDDLSSNVSVSQDDMPYGATLSVLKADSDGVPLSIDYDNRFVSNDEAKIVSNYFAAINSKNADLFSSCYYPGFGDYFASLNGSSSIADYLNSTYSSLESDTIGSAFKFSYVTITDCIAPSDDAASNYNFKRVDFYLKSFSGGNNLDIPDKITSRKVVVVDVMYDTASGNLSLDKRLKSDLCRYLYQIDGKYYVC